MGFFHINLRFYFQLQTFQIVKGCSFNYSKAIIIAVNNNAMSIYWFRIGVFVGKIFWVLLFSYYPFEFWHISKIWWKDMANSLSFGQPNMSPSGKYYFFWLLFVRFFSEMGLFFWEMLNFWWFFYRWRWCSVPRTVEGLCRSIGRNSTCWGKGLLFSSRSYGTSKNLWISKFGWFWFLWLILCKFSEMGCNCL